MNKFIKMATVWVADRVDGKEVWAVGAEVKGTEGMTFVPQKFIVITPNGVIRKVVKTKTAAMKAAC